MKSQSNLEKVKNKTEEELENDIKNDLDYSNIDKNWHEKAEIIVPSSSVKWKE